MNAKEKKIPSYQQVEVQWCKFKGKARLPLFHGCVLDDDIKNAKGEEKILKFSMGGN